MNHESCLGILIKTLNKDVELNTALWGQWQLKTALLPGDRIFSGFEAQ